MNFATDRLGQDMSAVIYEINFKGDRGIFFMSNRKFTAHPEEQEILVQDGLDYKIVSVQKSRVTLEDSTESIPLTKVKLIYPIPKDSWIK